jgi:hypothetical protein
MRNLVIGIILLANAAVPSLGAVVDVNAAYSVLTGRTEASRQAFYVYQDGDSGFNHGFPSGLFADNPGTLGKIHLNSNCLDDSSSPTGCSADPKRLDRQRVNVLQVVFDALVPGQFAGVNIEEPERWGADPRGVGYDLRGSSRLVFDARSPDGARVQFGVGGCVTPFMAISSTWHPISIRLASLQRPPNAAVSCPPNLGNVHLLFTAATSDANAPHGGTVLLDNVRFDPIAAAQGKRPSFPLSTQTFGVLPLQEPAAGRVPIPPDQELRNLTTTYETVLVLQALLLRGAPQDLVDARLLADALDYALRHDNQGDPLPESADRSVGLHNGYLSGDLPLLNDQGPDAGRAGQVRLAGFSAGDFCGETDFCLVLDGATGGNNAFAILALLSAYEKFGKATYLDDARTLAKWIAGNMTDKSGTGFGGYFTGYPDAEDPPKKVAAGKSVENNADIFVGFTRLAAAEARAGHAAAAALWTNRANVAGDFVLAMFDNGSGCFLAGTVPVNTPPGPGITPTGARRGNDVVNTFLFLDSNTFTSAALVESTRYRNRLDWRRPVQCALNRFGRSVAAGGVTYRGFSLDGTTAAGPAGIAWEFTGQMVMLMKLIDKTYGETAFEAQAALYLRQIRRAQMSSPFGDGRGLVASTLANGDRLPPGEQCLTTPFQCIPERVGLAATVWAIFADRAFNPLSIAP